MIFQKILIFMFDYLHYIVYATKTYLVAHKKFSFKKLYSIFIATGEKTS